MKILKAEVNPDNTGFVIDIHVDEDKVLPDTKQPDPRYVLRATIGGDNLDAALRQAKARSENYLAHLNEIDGVADVPQNTHLLELANKNLDQMIENGILGTEGKRQSAETEQGDEPTNLVPASTEKDSKANKVRKSTAVRKAMEAQSAEKTPNVNKEEGDKNPETPAALIGDDRKRKTRMAEKTKVKK